MTHTKREVKGMPDPCPEDKSKSILHTLHFNVLSFIFSSFFFSFLTITVARLASKYDYLFI